MSDQDDAHSVTDDGNAATPRRFLLRRAFWLLLALAVAWLVFRAYRQPDFLIDFVNMQLC